MGFEGFSGNESILYHLFSPCRVKEVGEFDADRARGVGARDARAPAHRHARASSRWATRCSAGACCSTTTTSRSGSASRRPRPTTSTATARATRSSSSTRARASSRRSSARCPYRKHDYVVIPRGTTYRFRFDEPQRWLTFYTPGEIETPNRYRNRYGQLLEHAPFSQRDFHPPAELVTHRDRGEHARQGPGARRLPGLRARLPPARRRRLGRLRLPVHVQHRRLRAQGRPPAPAAARAPDVPGPELRDLLVLPARCSTGTRRRSSLPYHHSNVQSEEVMYYVDGDYAARKGVDVGCHHAAPVGPAARPAAGHGGEVAGHEGDRPSWR